MNTITMTHEELRKAITYCDEKCPIAVKGGRCFPANCPIWRRIEAKEKRKAKAHERELRAKHPLAGSPLRTLAEIKAVVSSSKLVFGPSKVVGGGIVQESIHRTRLWCSACNAKRTHRLGNTGEQICMVCGSWRTMPVKKPVKRSCKTCGDKQCPNKKKKVEYCCFQWKPRRKG
jgi:hypothetical protein